MMSARNKLSVAVVGTGPASFFTSKQLLRAVQNVKIDFFEKAILPFGLVRNGIAPDHQDAKKVGKEFFNILGDERVSYFGRTEMGKDFNLRQLADKYSAVLIGTGAGSENNMGIEGEYLDRVYSSRRIVDWYNSVSNGFKPYLKGEKAVLIGNGNVSIDISRILLKDPSILRADSDASSEIIKELEESNTREVHILGRRGLLESAFSLKELRELSRVEGVNVVCFRDEVEGSIIEDKEMDNNNPGIERMLRRKVDFVKKLPLINRNEHVDGKVVYLRFLSNPKAFEQTKDGVKVKFAHRRRISANKYEEGPEFSIDCDIAVKSLGYAVVDDSDGVLKHAQGIYDNKFGQCYLSNGELADNIFVSGWAKRGPKGVVDMTLRDSFETADCMLKLYKNGHLKEKSYISPDFTDQFINWEQARTLLEVENERGKAINRLREKFTSEEQMMAYLEKL